jgi:hypothetical protein
METTQIPTMPTTQKNQLNAMNSAEIMDFQLRLQIQCDMTAQEAADYIAQAFDEE